MGKSSIKGETEMCLSTGTTLLRRKLDDKTAIRMIKEAGFDSFDYSFCYMLHQQIIACMQKTLLNSLAI